MTLTRDFLLGRTEVTNAQYLEALNWANAQGLVTVANGFLYQYNVRLMLVDLEGSDYCEVRHDADTQQFYLQAGTDTSYGFGPGLAYPTGNDPANFPVHNLSWHGAACYCGWRSLMENLPPYYNGQWNSIPSTSNPYEATGYRLPTEAEWEDAARFNDGRIYPWGDTSPSCTLANHLLNAYCVGWTSPVDACPEGANALGLLNMAGNAWEWCNDLFIFYPEGPVSDPVGHVVGTHRIIRGGSANGTATTLRCANRWYRFPSHCFTTYGLRLCRTAPRPLRGDAWSLR